jgi:hypothetical protein
MALQGMTTTKTDANNSNLLSLPCSQLVNNKKRPALFSGYD